jgi:hypothetical protein
MFTLSLEFWALFCMLKSAMVAIDHPWVGVSLELDTQKNIGYSLSPIKLVWRNFLLTYYMVTHKTVNVYYLNKSHDSLNNSCD